MNSLVRTIVYFGGSVFAYCYAGALHAGSSDCVQSDSWYSKESSRIWVGVVNNCPDTVDINVCVNIQGRKPVSVERSSKRVEPGDVWKFSFVEFQGRPFAASVRWCPPGKSTYSATCPAVCPAAPDGSSPEGGAAGTYQGPSPLTSGSNSKTSGGQPSGEHQRQKGSSEPLLNLAGPWSFRFSLPDCQSCKSDGNATLAVDGQKLSGSMKIRSLFSSYDDVLEGRILDTQNIELRQIRDGRPFNPHRCTVNQAVTQIVCNYTESTGQAGVLVFDR